MHRSPSARAFLLGLAALGAVGALPAAQAVVAPPPTCIHDVALGRGGEGGARVTLLLRDGRIEAVLDAGAEIPPGRKIVEGEDLRALPAFLDAFSTTGAATPAPVKDRDLGFDASADVQVDMRLANRKGVQPSFRVADVLAVTPAQAKAWQEAGFGVALVAPSGQLLAGTSAVVATREAAMRDVVLRPSAFAHGAFAASGPGYPSTLMGYFAQLRQFFRDVQWQSARELRYENGRPGVRPPFDADLAAGVALIGGKERLVCAAESHRDIERWIRLADEFRLDIAISGGRDAWRVADVLAARGIPVFLTLDWGKEVEDPRSAREGTTAEEKKAGDAAPAAPVEKETEEMEESWEYEEPLAVRIDRRLRWEETRDCALRLHEAGVRFAFGTGDEKPGKILDKVRELVAAGLPAEAAEAALTTEAAELLGVASRAGRIAPGYDATLMLWDGDPLTDEKARPVWVFVDGFATRYERKEGTEGDDAGGAAPEEDVSGTWVADSDEGGSTKLVLVMDEEGALSGKLHTRRPGGDERVSTLSGRVRGREVEFDATIHAEGFEIEVRGTLTLAGDTLEGEMSFKLPFREEPMVREVTARRVPRDASFPYSCHEVHGR